jgi:hypothetical protein
MSTAFGSIFNSADFFQPTNTGAVTIPLNTSASLSGMTLSGAYSLCPNTAGWYSVGYSVNTSTSANNYLTFSLATSAGVVPQSSASVNTTASDLENVAKNVIVYLNAGQCVFLQAQSTSGGNTYIPAGGASISAFKLSD